jgi:hypothetical protein
MLSVGDGLVELVWAARTEVEHEVIAEGVEFGTQWLFGITVKVPEWADLAVQCNAEKASAVSITTQLVLCKQGPKQGTTHSFATQSSTSGRLLRYPLN